MASTIRKLIIGLALVALVSPAVAGEIHVLSAQYGDPRTGELCNATAPIAGLCEGHRQCSFDVRNTSLCNDPAFLVVKQLAVKYTCGSGTYTTRISEYDTSRLECR